MCVLAVVKGPGGFEKLWEALVFLSPVLAVALPLLLPGLKPPPGPPKPPPGPNLGRA